MSVSVSAMSWMATAWGEVRDAIWLCEAGAGPTREITAMATTAVAAAKPAIGAGESRRFHHGLGSASRRAARTVSAANREPAVRGGAWSRSFQTASDSQESSECGALWFMTKDVLRPRKPAA